MIRLKIYTRAKQLFRLLRRARRWRECQSEHNRNIKWATLTGGSKQPPTIKLTTFFDNMKKEKILKVSFFIRCNLDFSISLSLWACCVLISWQLTEMFVTLFRCRAILLLVNFFSASRVHFSSCSLPRVLLINDFLRTLIYVWNHVKYFDMQWTYKQTHTIKRPGIFVKCDENAKKRWK